MRGKTMELLIAGNFSLSAQEQETLEKLGYRITLLEKEDGAELQDAEKYEAVICNFLFLHQDIRRFSNLRAIQLLSAGLDRVPVAYAEKKGIEIRNARGIYSIPVAEFAVMSALEAYKESFFFYENQKACRWEKRRDLEELSGKTVCIFGTGSVGTEAAKRFSGFTDDVTGVDLFPAEKKYFRTVYGTDQAEEALKRSDVVVLTLPLTEETFHLFSDRLLGAMKEDAVLINVARGGLIDDEALRRNLARGRFRAVILDAFEEEPLAADYWGWKAERVRIIPHNSFVSDRNDERMKELVMKNLAEWSAKAGNRG